MAEKHLKEVENRITEAMPAAESYLDKILGDVSKKSATKQILLGSASGWWVLWQTSIFIVI